MGYWIINFCNLFDICISSSHQSLTYAFSAETVEEEMMLRQIEDDSIINWDLIAETKATHVLTGELN